MEWVIGTESGLSNAEKLAMFTIFRMTYGFDKGCRKTCLFTNRKYAEIVGISHQAAGKIIRSLVSKGVVSSSMRGKSRYVTILTSKYHNKKFDIFGKRIGAAEDEEPDFTPTEDDPDYLEYLKTKKDTWESDGNVGLRIENRQLQVAHEEDHRQLQVAHTGNVRLPKNPKENKGTEDQPNSTSSLNVRQRNYSPSSLEIFFLKEYPAWNIPAPYPEYAFNGSFFDFVWLGKKVALEIQGGAYLKRSYHDNTNTLRQLNKHAALEKEGWLVLTADTHDIRTPAFYDGLKKLIDEREGPSEDDPTLERVLATMSGEKQSEYDRASTEYTRDDPPEVDEAPLW